MLPVWASKQTDRLPKHDVKATTPSILLSHFAYHAAELNLNSNTLARFASLERDRYGRAYTTPLEKTCKYDYLWHFLSLHPVRLINKPGTKSRGCPNSMLVIHIITSVSCPLDCIVSRSITHTSQHSSAFPYHPSHAHAHLQHQYGKQVVATLALPAAHSPFSAPPQQA